MAPKKPICSNSLLRALKLHRWEDQTVLTMLGDLARDRFVIFIVLGMGLFGLNAYLEGNSRRIDVTPSDIEMLGGRWEAQMGTPPTPDELSGLVDYHVREEILVREARRLGLDKDDVILRRRLEQKMELLIKDSYQPSAPTDAELETFYAQNMETYRTPKRVGFRHVFLGPADDVDGDAANELLGALANGPDDDWRSVGKPFMLARQFGPRSERELTELFGAEFAGDMIAQEAPGGWRGPVVSSYGAHLVQTLTVSPERTPSLDELHDRVAADFREAEASRHEAEAWRELLEKYRVRIDAPSL